MIIMLLSQVVVKVEKWEGNSREKHFKESRALTKLNGINAEVVEGLELKDLVLALDFLLLQVDFGKAT